MRVGLGYDAHRLRPGLSLKLGGVTVPFEQGLEGHSDGDALLHAICDAMLGAARLGDLGAHFPSERGDLKGISSLQLLADVGQKIGRRGFRIVNIDGVVIAERPRLGPYIQGMQEVIAQTLGISEDQVSIKATTTDRMGFAGRGEGMVAQAVVLLQEGR